MIHLSTNDAIRSATDDQLREAVETETIVRAQLCAIMVAAEETGFDPQAVLAAANHRMSDTTWMAVGARRAFSQFVAACAWKDVDLAEDTFGELQTAFERQGKLARVEQLLREAFPGKQFYDGDPARKSARLY